MPVLCLRGFHILAVFFLLTLLSSLTAAADTGSPTCGNCSAHGVCESGYCRCDAGYLKSDCSLQSTMQPIVLGDMNSFRFYWQLEGDMIHMRIAADSDLLDFYSQDAAEHGWAAVMFGAEDGGMIDGRLVRVGLPAAGPEAVNMYSAAYNTPAFAENTVSGVTGFLVPERGIDVSFSSPLAPLLKPPFTADGITPVSWAWGTVLDPMSQHTGGHHGSLRVVLSEQRVAEQSLAFYYPALASLLAALVLGLLMQLSLVKYSAVGQCCLHRRLPSLLCCCRSGRRQWRTGAERIPSEEKDDHLITPHKPNVSRAASLLSFLSQDVTRTLLSMSYAELSLVSLYCLTLLAVAVLGWRSFTSWSEDPLLLLGHLASLHLALTLLPTTRNGLLLFVFSMPYERAIAYHRYCSRLCYLFTCLHGLTTYGEHGGLHGLTSTRDLPHGDGEVWGTLCWLLLTVMVLTSLALVRRRQYELFYFLHLALFLPAVTFAAKHSDYFRWFLVLPTALLLTDWVRSMRRTHNGVVVSRLRLLQGERDRVLLVTAVLPSWRLADVKAGSYVMINVPSLSTWQWHPYSLCGLRRAGEDDAAGVEVDVCLLDSGVGSWSWRLCEQVEGMKGQRGMVVERQKAAQAEEDGSSARAERTTEEEEEAAAEADGAEWSRQASSTATASSSARSTSPSPHVLTVTPSFATPLSMLGLNVYGPCGRLSFNPLHYRRLVLVAGGVGITPCIAIAQSLLSLSLAAQSSQSSSASPSQPFVWLIWSSRNPSFLSQLFPSVLQRMSRSSHCRLLLFDSSQHGTPGQVAKRRRLTLAAEEDTGAAEVDIYAGRPNVPRLLEWIHSQGADGHEGEAEAAAGGGGRGGGGAEVEMVIQMGKGQGRTEEEEGEDEDDRLADLSLEDEDDDAASIGSSSGSAEDEGSAVKRDMGCVVCGPMLLIDDVESACNARGIDLHKETFLI